MGWVKTPIKKSEQIYSEIISSRPNWNGRIGDSTCPYEYWSDWLRDNYDLTLKQSGEICKWLKDYYNIKEFYYTECKCYKVT